MFRDVTSITTTCWSTSKEIDELVAPPVEAPTAATLFFCFRSQVSTLSLFSAASFSALLRGEGVESLDGSAKAFSTFFLPLRLYSGSSSLFEVSTLAYFSCCS